MALPPLWSAIELVPHFAVAGQKQLLLYDSDNAGLYRPLVPSRLLDTRSGLGGSTTLGPGQTASVTVLGQGNVPATGVSAVVLNNALNSTNGLFGNATFRANGIASSNLATGSRSTCRGHRLLTSSRRR